ncbi:HAMP domain-containing histidine kinase [Kineosporia rhizophila]|uniref:sensor histidine kinase n=1 Tax=Kineosporia rhizophila TaxID=84633 RepID=UPI001E4908A2|nr:HAMP domain-containing sensor histidine kinase [Kineosporia rhizophila]MCE0535518.1 HAMP domain-containing histidine kinase [Kineosporia rhizophila]
MIRLRHRLLTRLLATSLLIVVMAVTATAWLATRTATQALQQAQGRTLSDERALYDTLTKYAATHPNWSGVDDLVTEQAAVLERRVTLTTPEQQVLADSAPGLALPGAQPVATIDPLRTDTGPPGEPGTFDARAVGPFRLTADEVTMSRKLTTDVMSCLRKISARGQLEQSPSGRWIVEIIADPSGEAPACTSVFSSQYLPTERRALKALRQDVAQCLGKARDAVEIVVAMNPTRMPPTFAVVDRTARPSSNDRLQSCLDRSRREQLRPWTAPAAQLYLTDPDTGRAATTFELSRDNVVRIVLVAGAVVLAAAALTVLVGRRLVRPLRVLAEGAARQQPVPVLSKDEIGAVALALNEAMQRRDTAEEQRRALVSDVAHELRSPLTNIRSWLEATQDGLAEPDTNLIELLHEETVVLEHILRDMSDLAAADAGRLRVRPVRLDLREVVEFVVDAHRGGAEGAGVRLTDAVDDGVPVLADPVRLRQALGNLVSNGIRYTPAGGTVRVSGSRAGDRAVITVEDTGVGIAPEHLPHVFDRFWRADHSRARATGGSGLGLAIARQLLEAQAGTITVASSLGKGTTFTVTVPAA